MINLHKTQNEVAKDTHRFRVCCNGRRWGKSMLAIEEIKGKAVARPKRIAYIGPTIQQTRDIAWELLKKELQGAITSHNETRLEMKCQTVSGEESNVTLRGWESIETLRGQKFDFLVMDEVASMRNFWVAWNEVIRPTLTDTKGEVMFISTPRGYNHFFELYNMQDKDDDFKSFHFTTYDNPYIPFDEIEKARREMPSFAFAQEYMAEFTKMEGLVFKEFLREKHLYSDHGTEPAFIERIAGVDFGFKNPAAVIHIGIDAEHTFWVTNEWYKTEITDSRVADYVAGHSFNKVYPDPESASGVEEMKQRGVNVREVVKGKDSIKNGIDRVREKFMANKIKIHKDCVNLISELEMYSYPDKKDMKNESENPIDEYNHAIDALRYAVFMWKTGTGPGAAQVYYPAPAYQPRATPLAPGAGFDDRSPQEAHVFIPGFK